MLQLKYPIHALPGFLGLASDWNEALKGLSPTIHSLSNKDQILPFWDWAKNFNAQVATQSVLAGYSLGGRLAMHAVLLEPVRWKGLIIVSTHIGLNDPFEKKERVLQDQRWAARFRSSDWQIVMQEWNQQEVFSSRFTSPNREEEDYSRNALAGILDKWSLGKQEYLYEKICALEIPILWVVGEYDQKLLSITQKLTLAHPLSKIWIASNAGHRVIFDAAENLNKQINNFIFNLG